MEPRPPQTGHTNCAVENIIHVKERYHMPLGLMVATSAFAVVRAVLWVYGVPITLPVLPGEKLSSLF